MNAITVQQPYASLIMAGIKKFETRSKPTKVRGKLLLHASAARHWNFQGLCFDHKTRPYLIDMVDPVEVEMIRLLKENKRLADDRLAMMLRNQLHNQLPVGAIIGVVNLIDCIPASEIAAGKVPGITYGDWQRESLLGDLDCSAGPRYAYIMEPVEILERPIPARGQLGIYSAEKLNPGVLEGIRNKFNTIVIQ